MYVIFMLVWLKQFINFFKMTVCTHKIGGISEYIATHWPRLSKNFLLLWKITLYLYKKKMVFLRLFPLDCLWLLRTGKIVSTNFKRSSNRQNADTMFSKFASVFIFLEWQLRLLDFSFLVFCDVTSPDTTQPNLISWNIGPFCVSLILPERITSKKWQAPNNKSIFPGCLKDISTNAMLFGIIHPSSILFNGSLFVIFVAIKHGNVTVKSLNASV